MPTAPGDQLDRIKTYLEGLASPFVRFRVVNPIYVRVKVNAVVQFTRDSDPGANVKRLNDDLVSYLSPWYYDAERAAKQGRYAVEDEIADFIEMRPYVEALDCIDLSHDPDPSALATIYAYGDCMAQMGESPDALAHHLSWLQQDLTDPDFRRHTVVQAKASRGELQRLVQQGIAEGAFKPDVDAATLARAIEVTVGGSLMSWAIHQEGQATAWIRHDLDVLLEGHLSAAARRRRRRKSLLSRKRVPPSSTRRLRLRNR